RLAVDVLKLLLRLQEIDGLSRIRQRRPDVRSCRLTNTLKLLSDHAGRLAARDRGLALRLGQLRALPFLRLLSFVLKLLLRQAGALGAAFVVRCEPKPPCRLGHWVQIFDGELFWILRLKRDFADARFKPRRMVCDQSLPLKLDRLVRLAKQRPMVLRRKLVAGRLGQMRVLLLRKLELLLVPSHRARDGPDEFLLVRSLLLAKALPGLSLRLGDACFPVALRLLPARGGTFAAALLRFALVLGLRLDVPQAEIVELPSGAADDGCGAVGVRLNQYRLAFGARAVRTNSDP